MQQSSPAALAGGPEERAVKRARSSAETETPETEESYRRRLTRVLATMQRPALVEILVSM